jgi:hypothetical protein
MLVDLLGLGGVLASPDDTARVLQSWRAAPNAEEMRFRALCTTQRSLGVPNEPFLLALCNPSHVFARYDVVMEQAQQWFFEGTQAKKRQLLAMKKTIDHLEASDAIENETPALCLLCGAFLRAGEKIPVKHGMGACHRHVGLRHDKEASPEDPAFMPRWGQRDCAEGQEKNDAHHACCPAGGKSGVGLFLLLNRTSVLLVRKSWSCYWPSIYVDEFGEEDVNMRRGMPLTLSPSRAGALWALYESGGISDAVTQKRMSSDRVLRKHWY